ncbi:growth/differentiation factor 2 [Trichomycterus rosablanca]|uniref:growth/differentiation factor 2 n=1 Tax=Trichomycterus rosablanca TaxID=2290929 RepID=UPI002F35C955
MVGFRYLFLYLYLGLVGPCQGRSVRDATRWKEGKDLLDEADDPENLFGPVEGDFLKMLNLSGVPQEQRQVRPPLFMMELYNRYAADTSSVPHADVIRSFVIRDATRSVTSKHKNRLRLLFNVSIPTYEKVTRVQLQLFTLWDGDQSACCDVFTSVSVYNVVHLQNRDIFQLLDRRDVGSAEHSWEAFDVTSGVQKWLQSKRGAGELQVDVQSHGCGSSETGGKNISLNLEDNTSPVLIVFSDDLENRNRKAKSELTEMMTHEEQNFFLNPDPFEDSSNEVELDRHPRRKRSPRKDFCHRTSMKVNFKDIGWDKWIVAPPEYEAYECKGACSFPLTDKVTPSKHAIIQTLVNLRNPKKVNKACCVPTKLDPLTVMYQENGVITVRHLYEEMKVAKCGCR